MDLLSDLVKTGRPNNNMLIKDYLRFNFNIWPLPDSKYDEEDKYYNQIYTVLTVRQNNMLDALFSMGIKDGWSRETLVNSLRILLSKHTNIINNDSVLTNLVSIHTGAALSVTKELGRELNSFLHKIVLDRPLVVYRTLSRDYYPPIKIGETFKSYDIWSTSYDPISSLGFGISDPEVTETFVLRIHLPMGFRGGLLVENNIRDTVKEQHEVIVGSGIYFNVIDIVTTKVILFDDTDGIRPIIVKVYDLRVTSEVV